MDFFKELEALQSKSPRLGMLQLNAINSSYNFAVDQVKNCYRIANAVKNEDCMYGRDIYDCTDCVDCDHIRKSSLCYGCLNCTNCYNGNFLQDCEDCTDCSYGYDLRGCSNCFGCAGLRKKEYHIFNKPYSKEEYFAAIASFASLAPDKIASDFEAVKKASPRLYSVQNNSENCIGNYIHNSKNAFFSFDLVGCQDVGYLMESKNLRDSYDITILEDAELCYEISSSHILNNCNFCYMCVSSSDLEYCEFVNNSKYCFGCISLNHKEYHILNRPYSKDEYFKRVTEIKDQLKAENLYNRRFLPSTYPLEDTAAMWDKM